MDTLPSLSSVDGARKLAPLRMTGNAVVRHGASQTRPGLGLGTNFRPMKTKFATLAFALILSGTALAEPDTLGTSKDEPGTVMPTQLGAPDKLKRYNVTIRRFDPKKGLEGGQDFVLPVDCIDEEHAISSTLSNAVAFTKKSQGSEILSVAFCCMGIEERK